VATARTLDAGGITPVISGDGRYVVYDGASDLGSATNTVCLTRNAHPSDSIGSCGSVFVRDRVANRTVNASVSSNGAGGDDNSLGGTISRDGHTVGFISFASNLVVGDTNNSVDTFVHDLRTGRTVRVSVTSSGQQTTSSYGYPHDLTLSADGRYAVFPSNDAQLTRGHATSTCFDVAAHESRPCMALFRHDMRTGATTMVTVGADGTAPDGDSHVTGITPDGRYVSYWSDAENLTRDDHNLLTDMFVTDLVTHRTELVSVSSSGRQTRDTSSFSYTKSGGISDDGRFVAFVADDDDLVSGDDNGLRDAFVRDRVLHRTERVSITSSGDQAELRGPDHGGYEVRFASLSPDGRYVVFESFADNLVAGDTNQYSDVFEHDRRTGRTMRFSLGPNGHQAEGQAQSPSVADDGRTVAFHARGMSADTDPTHDYVYVSSRPY
jgi:Tol biopolymer transport system component